MRDGTSSRTASRGPASCPLNRSASLTATPSASSRLPPHAPVRRQESESDSLPARWLRLLQAPSVARFPLHPRKSQDIHRIQRHHVASLRAAGESQLDLFSWT